MLRIFVPCNLLLSYGFPQNLLFGKKKGCYKLLVTIKLFSVNRHSKELLKKECCSITKSNPSQKYQCLEAAYCRTFLQFPGSMQSTTREYTGRKLVGYSMEQMFDVVSDVENYNKFVPFCKKSAVSVRTTDYLKANLIIGFPPVVESYTSTVTLIKPNLVKAVCKDGKLFHHLLTTWKFSQGLKNNPSTCIIDFFVSFEFRSLLHSQLANMFFNELVRQMENAFYQEAKARYGKASIKIQHLSVLSKES